VIRNSIQAEILDLLVTEGDHCENRRLHIGPIEAIDGTTVVDIKPALRRVQPRLESSIRGGHHEIRGSDQTIDLQRRAPVGGGLGQSGARTIRRRHTAMVEATS